MQNIQEVAFRIALDDKPDDWDTRLIYSDWLEEQGRERDAAAQRWMVEHKKCPHKGYWKQEPYMWDWFKLHEVGEGDPELSITCCLELDTYHGLNSDVTRFAQYYSRVNAERALGNRLFPLVKNGE